MTKTIYPASLLCDLYKLNHREQYPSKTEYIYSTYTPRSNKHFPQADGAVVAGIQAAVKKYLINYFNEHFFSREKHVVVGEYGRLLKFALGVENPDSSHIAELHDLGYLPIKVKALKEGSIAPMQTPVLTMENTNPKFFWLTNYLETLISTEIWQPMTSATTSHLYRKILDKHAMKTVGHTEDVGFQAHDFSMRGMPSLESAVASSAGHLLSFPASETIPAIYYLEEYYNANIEKELVSSGIPATEHSVMVALTDADGDRDEYDAFKHLITEVYPSGFVSIVSDSFDFWRTVEETLPRLKKEIMNRDGKTVIRPDSGNPSDIICGKNIEDISKRASDLESAKRIMKDTVKSRIEDETPHGEYGAEESVGEFKFNGKYYRIQVGFCWNRYDKQYYYIDESEIESFEKFTPKAEDLGLVESLYNLFGGTVNELGYKVLDSHIGCIYGDGITLELAEGICQRLEEKGFASTNVVLGVGSYSFTGSKTRDSLGFAMKATHAVINGEERMLFKDPKTDPGKRSQRGLVAVIDVDGKLHCKDGLNKAQYDTNYADIDQLEVVFENGKLLRDESLSEIRERLQRQ